MRCVVADQWQDCAHCARLILLIGPVGSTSTRSFSKLSFIEQILICRPEHYYRLVSVHRNRLQLIPPWQSISALVCAVRVVKYSSRWLFAGQRHEALTMFRWIHERVSLSLRTMDCYLRAWRLSRHHAMHQTRRCLSSVQAYFCHTTAIQQDVEPQHRCRISQQARIRRHNKFIIEFHYFEDTDQDLNTDSNCYSNFNSISKLVIPLHTFDTYRWSLLSVILPHRHLSFLPQCLETIDLEFGEPET